MYMRSIKHRFISFQEKRPAGSRLLNLAAAVKDQNFSTDRISRALTRLVERDDYGQSDRPLILRHLVQLSQNTKGLEAYGNWGKNGLPERAKAIDST